MAESTIEASAAIPGEDFSRVALTAEAVELLWQLWRRHGPLMFHQSGGCCDGSSPMCYPAGELLTGDADVLLGIFDIADDVPTGEAADVGPQPVEFWMSREQFAYWSHTHLTVDVVSGRGSGFSLEAPEGKRFLIRSRLFE
ncbi:DUF779 domain-containing protein [Arthrobacter castelli]|uniref:DUF779 domain-containing protein n=1 Tax=Arthrobacter castelli TaxID=271431 RepID=UPI000408B69E|nr:DUF779 domain-containing protein [Arthrobacter castelli]